MQGADVVLLPTKYVLVRCRLFAGRCNQNYELRYLHLSVFRFFLFFLLCVAHIIQFVY